MPNRKAPPAGPRRVSVSIDRIPPRELNPNARVHWSVRAQMANEFRALAKMYALDQTHFERPMFERCRLTVDIYVRLPRHVVRDDDNAAATLKPAVDGCVDAGILVDDKREHLHLAGIAYHVDPTHGSATVLVFEEVPADAH